MAFELPDLPYAHNALAEGGMSEETLQFHHDLHHKAYVDNGNKLLAGSGLEGNSLEEIVVATYNDDLLEAGRGGSDRGLTAIAVARCDFSFSRRHSLYIPPQGALAPRNHNRTNKGGTHGF